MAAKKNRRIDLFEEIAKSVNPTGSIAHVPGLFLRELRSFLHFSDNEISTLFGVSRIAVLRKRSSQSQAKNETVKETPSDNSGEASELEAFMSAELSPSQELKFLKGYGRRMLETLPKHSQARMTLYRILIENSEKKVREDVDEGKELMVELLNEIKSAFLEARDQVGKEFKKQITQTLTHFCEVMTDSPDRDPRSIRDSLLTQAEAFDPCELLIDIFVEKPTIKREIERYTARKENIKAPSLRGGGVVGSPESKKGGKQYEQAERRLNRENGQDN